MSRKLVYLLLPLLYFLVLSCNDDKIEQYDALVQRADSLMRIKKYDEAKTLFFQANHLNLKIDYASKQIHKIDSILIEENKKAKYNQVINEANRLFEAASYKAAKNAYNNALRIKPKDEFASTRILDIDYLLSENELSNSNESDPNQYKIIVGSFKVKSNAERLQKKLTEKGIESYLIPRFGNSFTAVTFASYPDIHKAYNNLDEARASIHPDAWVLLQKE